MDHSLCSAMTWAWDISFTTETKYWIGFTALCHVDVFKISWCTRASVL